MRSIRYIVTALTTFLLVPIVVSAQATSQDLTPEQRARMQMERETRVAAELISRRPIEALNSIWIE